MAQQFDASRHPDVVSGYKTRQQVRDYCNPKPLQLPTPWTALRSPWALKTTLFEPQITSCLLVVRCCQLVRPHLDIRPL